MSKQEITVLPLAIKRWRKEKQWSQKELASRAGVSPTLIALIETGDRQPSRENAEAIAAAFGVELEVLAVVHGTKLADRIAGNPKAPVLSEDEGAAA